MGGDARRGGGARGVAVPGEPWTGVCAHGGDVWRAAKRSTSFSAYRRGVLRPPRASQELLGEGHVAAASARRLTKRQGGRGELADTRIKEGQHRHKDQGGMAVVAHSAHCSIGGRVRWRRPPPRSCGTRVRRRALFAAGQGIEPATMDPTRDHGDPTLDHAVQASQASIEPGLAHARSSGGSS